TRRKTGAAGAVSPTVDGRISITPPTYRYGGGRTPSAARTAGPTIGTQPIAIVDGVHFRSSWMTKKSVLIVASAGAKPKGPKSVVATKMAVVLAKSAPRSALEPSRVAWRARVAARVVTRSNALRVTPMNQRRTPIQRSSGANARNDT